MRDWILVVDDDDDVRESLGMILDIEGFASKEAANGQKALELINKHQNDLPALIFMDVWMPVMGGVGFMKVRKLDPVLKSIPAYLFSADANITGLSEGLEATGYLSKPVEMVDVLAVAAKHCTRDASVR